LIFLVVRFLQRDCQSQLVVALAVVLVLPTQQPSQEAHQAPSAHHLAKEQDLQVQYPLQRHLPQIHPAPDMVP